MRPIRIFYFVADAFPAWRVDLVELFGVQLRSMGVETMWSTRRKDAGWMRSCEMHGQRAILPLSLGMSSTLGRLLNRILEPVSELVIFVRLVFGKGFDIVQVRDDRYTAAVFAMIAARIRGARFTYWMSFPFPENDLEMARTCPPGLRRCFLQIRGTVTRWWLYRFVLRVADHVFVQSERMRAHVAAMGIQVAKLTPVPMGVPPRLLELARDNAMSTAVVPQRIVYLGTLARSRRLETIVDAFALVHQRFPESTLLFVGDGDVPSERRDLEARVSRLGLKNAVTFTGFIPMAEAWCIVASANVCLSPFPPSVVQDTASPTKLVEYMALGKTVVANTHPEQSAILDDCGAGVLVDWGSDAFAHGIVWAFAEPQEAADRARRGPTWVRLHRDYASIAADVNRRLRELLGEPAQPVHFS